MTSVAASSLEQEMAVLTAEISTKKQRLLDLKRRLGQSEVKDYGLKGKDGATFKLSSLFGEKEALILVHNMGGGCPDCTMWADGFNGVIGHLENRAAFVVVSPDEPEVQARIAAKRGWTFRMVSSKGSTFSKDLGFELEGGNPMPGVSVISKQADGRLMRVAKDFFGPGDDYCAPWHFFDLLPGGVGEWEPRLEY